MTERVSSGVEGLDAVIEGGFPRGSLILLAGNPGTGKTVFSTQFLVKGAESGEAGVYVSFAEEKSLFIRNVSKHLDCDLKRLEDEGKVRLLDLVAFKEAGVSASLDVILSEVESVKAKRLVIDSFTAMAQAFKEPIDVRVVVHAILSKVTRQMGCTTIMIEEVPIGESRIGLGLEEFVADCVIVLRTNELDGRLLRELEIKKLRGTKLQERKFIFTLEGGFKAFLPFKPKTIKEPRKFQSIPDPPSRYSTGISDLDAILGGGYSKGSYNLLEVDSEVPPDAYGHVIRSTELNFLRNGNAFISLPSTLSPEQLKTLLTPHIGEETFNQNARIAQFGIPSERPYALCLNDENIEESFSQLWSEVERLRAGKDRPVFSLIDLAMIEYIYGREAELKVLGKAMASVRRYGDTRLNVAKPSVTLIKEFRDVCDIHLRMRTVNGTIIMYGVKPHTGLYHFDIDISKGYPMPKLTPVI